MVRSTVRPDALMDAAALAEYMGVPLATVYRWNSHGSGPRRFRVGKYVRYRTADVDAWLDQRSEGGPAS
ncbi:MAG: helix-turn-helix transcriptional regulator [Pseudonocardiaceae bacterium]